MNVFAGEDRGWMRRVMRRIELSGPVLGIVRGAPGDGLGERAAIIQQIAERLMRVCVGLSGELLDADLRSLMVRLFPGSSTLAVRIGSGLRLLGDIAGVSEADLEEMGRKEQAAATLWQVAARLKNNAMDARLFLGAFGWFLVDRVVRAIEEAFAGPLINKQKSDLLDAFAAALLAYDAVLRRSHERRQELQKQREKLGQQVKEAQDRAWAEWTMLEYLHGLARPSRDALVAAARIHMEGRDQQPGLLADQPVVEMLEAET